MGVEEYPKWVCEGGIAGAPGRVVEDAKDEAEAKERDGMWPVTAEA